MISNKSRWPELSNDLSLLRSGSSVPTNTKTLEIESFPEQIVRDKKKAKPRPNLLHPRK